MAWQSSSLIALARSPSCLECLVRDQYHKYENFPIVGDTVGQLQDSAAFREFEVSGFRTRWIDGDNNAGLRNL